jgi:sulfate permease, SulP family
VQKHGYDGLVVCTLLAGVGLVAMGLAGLGGLIKFIPYPVVTGFTSGIAVVIFSSQVKDFLGLEMGAVPADFMEKWEALFRALATVNVAALGVAAGSLAILVFWPKVSRVVPGPFVAMLAATAAVAAFDLPVETIGSRFGAVPSSLPVPHIPRISWSVVRELFHPAFTIALLAAIESLLSAVVADGMIGGRHQSNVELVAQGVANIASPIFGGIPATGALARTATNVKSGGRTPLAGIVHAATLFLVLSFFGRWAALVPLPALAAILVVVAYHMSEWRSFAGLLRAPRSDVVVLVLTFLLTVFVDLTVAVQFGIVAAALLFMRRMAEVTQVAGVTDALRETDRESGRPEALVIPKGVEVYEVNGPFFFGAADKLKSVLAEVSKKPKVLILRMRNVPAIDATGVHALEQLYKRCRTEGIAFVLAEIHGQPLRAIVRSKLPLFGRHNLAKSLDLALSRARDIVEKNADPMESTAVRRARGASQLT